MNYTPYGTNKELDRLVDSDNVTDSMEFSNLIDTLNNAITNSMSSDTKIIIVQDKNADEPTIMALYLDTDKIEPTVINNDGSYLIADTVMGKANLVTGVIEFMGGEVVNVFPDNTPEDIGHLFTERALNLLNNETYLQCLTNELNVIADINKSNFTFVPDIDELTITAVDESKNIIGKLDVTHGSINMGNDNVITVPDMTGTKDLVYYFADKVNDHYKNNLTALKNSSNKHKNNAEKKHTSEYNER